MKRQIRILTAGEEFTHLIGETFNVKGYKRERHGETFEESRELVTAIYSSGCTPDIFVYQDHAGNDACHFYGRFEVIPNAIDKFKARRASSLKLNLENCNVNK